MTAMDFPLNPNDGDTHDNYVYDATHGVWNQNPQQLAARFIASDTAPTSPSTGDAWFDTETGKTYVYHDSSWVESGNPVLGYQTVKGLADTNIPTNPLNGQALIYDSASEKWIAGSSGASLGLVIALGG